MVVLDARHQDGVQVESEPQHVLLVVRIRPLHVLLGKYRIRLSRPLERNLRLRRGDAQMGHQLRLPLRVLALVSLEHDGAANASCVRQRGGTASAANQLRQRIVLLLHDFREMHLEHAMLPHFHGNRHCPRVHQSLDVQCSATMQTCKCEPFVLSHNSHACQK